MRLFSASALAMATLVGAVSDAYEHAVSGCPVIDLRVGLAESVVRDGSLAEGVGQAGYLALKKGGVAGVLIPLAGRRESGTPSLSERYWSLITALRWSQLFEVGGCRQLPGRIASWLEIEAPDELAQDPSLVGLWAARGARVFAVATSRDGDAATAAGVRGVGAVSGLTPAGKNLVRRVFAEGGVVDVSNASEPSIDDVIELAKAAHGTVIATHSNARALADDPRNLSDTQIREIANGGGLVAVTAAHGLLAPGRAPTLNHLVRQISYLVQLVGAEHVALGIGFESGVAPVKDFRSAADFPRLAMALRAAGLRAEDVARVFYQNAQSVLCPALGGRVAP